MIRIGNSGTIRTGAADAFAQARERFARDGYLKLEGFVAPPLLDMLLGLLDTSDWYERRHDGIGVELCAVPGLVSGTLELASNDPVLFTAIDELTGCGSIGCFEGRVYRLAPTEGHYDSWHSDVGQDRLIAMSVNLGRDPFEGGLLQIRRNDSDQFVEVANRVTGDAVIFRIDPEYRHRVGSVTGQRPRTAWAGWFRRQPNYEELITLRSRERVA